MLTLPAATRSRYWSYVTKSLFYRKHKGDLLSVASLMECHVSVVLCCSTTEALRRVSRQLPVVGTVLRSFFMTYRRHVGDFYSAGDHFLRVTPYPSLSSSLEQTDRAVREAIYRRWLLCHDHASRRLLPCSRASHASVASWYGADFCPCPSTVQSAWLLR